MRRLRATVNAPLHTHGVPIALLCALSLGAAPSAAPAPPALQTLQVECVSGPAATEAGPPLRWAIHASREASGLGSRYKVWAQCAPGAQFDAAAHADAAAAAAVVESLWGPMTTLMGPPLPDAGGPDEGGDRAIDFYVLALGQSVFRDGEVEEIVGVLALASPSEPRNAPTASGFILLGRQDIRKPAFRGFVAHEFFHVLQNAHNLDTTLREDQFHWFVEASAMWAQAHFDPASAATYVHPAFIDHFQPAFESLHSTNGDHTFASYVWPLFMEQETRGAAAIANAWRAMAAAKTWDDLNDAIDSQLSFAAHFRDFALRNVNDVFDGQNVIGTRYVDRDRSFPDKQRPASAVVATIEVPDGTSSRSFPVDLPSLTASYHAYTISGGGQVTFDFSGVQPAGDFDVDALVKIAGKGWEPRPRRFSGGGRLRFCLDRPEEEVEQVYLVLSNHQKREESRIQGSVEVQAEADPCEDDADAWVGTATVRVTQTLTEQSQSDFMTRRFNSTGTGEVSYSFQGGTATAKGTYSAREVLVENYFLAGHTDTFTTTITGEGSDTFSYGAMDLVQFVTAAGDYEIALPGLPMLNRSRTTISCSGQCGDVTTLTSEFSDSSFFMSAIGKGTSALDATTLTGSTVEQVPLPLGITNVVTIIWQLQRNEAAPGR